LHQIFLEEPPSWQLESFLEMSGFAAQELSVPHSSGTEQDAPARAPQLHVAQLDPVSGVMK